MSFLFNSYMFFVSIFIIIYIVSYIVLALLSYVGIKKYTDHEFNTKNYVLEKSNNVLGVSVIAPAFNEGPNVVFNVKSLLSLNYPKFEIIVVNDGSSDDTLEKLIEEFELIKVPFYYQEKIVTAPVRGHYKSSNPIYSKLLVVDKINKKSKADASNAGINSSKYPLFLCTDVDCILKNDTIIKLAKPFMESKVRIIGTGAGIRASNSSIVKEGFLLKVHYPKQWYPRFQELEYVRAFLFGRMAMSQLNGVLIISGGLGMLDKEIAILAGGYSHKSLGEDMEIVTRMRKYMCDNNLKFAIKYLPESLCWTEVPSTVNVLISQRSRWARGLVQTLYTHKNIFFNRKYGKLSFLIFPYFFFFEFLVPILELIGIIILIIIFFFWHINYMNFLKLTFIVYLFYLVNTLISISIDDKIYKNYASVKELSILILMAIIEPVVYHPITVFASLKGYWQFFNNQELKWGNMQRQGFTTENKK